MFDSKKIDAFFVSPKTIQTKKTINSLALRERIKKLVKLALPCFAATLIVFLIVYPQLKKDINNIAINTIVPKKGELEKFHMEKGVFHITDAQNMVNNFHADFLDETEAGSKIIKMINPVGTLPTSQNDRVQIKSPIGHYNQNNKLLTLSNGVDIVYSAGITTKTEEMFVDFNTGKAYGIKPITTKSQTAEANAEGFEYYKDQNLLIYTGKSHVTINTDNNEGGF